MILFNSSLFNLSSAAGNPRHYIKTPKNCISYYRMEEGLRVQELCDILGIASRSSAKEVCAAPHPSAKYIHILASREGISIPEFLRRYAPSGEDAA